MHDFFVTGGTLRQDARCYVERAADAELCVGLERGEFCYVLTPRQTGKSSLMVRAANRLRQTGHTVLVLDLTTLGRNLSVEQWYYGLLQLAAGQLRMREELREFWLAHPLVGPLQRWVMALREVVLPRLKARDGEPGAVRGDNPSRLILFIDEIDFVQSLPFSTDEFFAAIRECYNRRAADPELEYLTFCFLGVALPSDLIRDPRTTPFNVGRRIVLNDFRLPEAEALVEGLKGDPEQPDRSPALAQTLLRRVMYWTCGHPYLTQRLCFAIAGNPEVRSTRGVDHLCRELFFTHGAEERDDNLLFVRQRLQNGGSDMVPLLELYRKVRKGRYVAGTDTDPLISRLRLTGVVREQHGRLYVRTRIYERVFDDRWIQAQLPEADLRRQRAAYRLGLLRGAGTALLGVTAAAGVGFGIYQSGLARQDRALARLDRGAQRLASGDRAGLADLQEAAQTTNDPAFSSAVTRLRDEWYREFTARKLAGLPLTDSLEALAFSRDGKRLATAGMDGAVTVWSTDGWRPLFGPLKHASHPKAVTFSPDGKRLAVRAGPEVLLWTLSARPAAVRLRLGTPIHYLEFSPDGARLAACSSKEMREWETSSGKQVGSAHTYPFGLRLCGYGRTSGQLYLVSGTMLHWVGAAPGARREPVEIGHASLWVRSPAGRFLAVAYEGIARVVDLETGRLSPRLDFNSPSASLVFSPDERYLTAAEGSRATVWEISTGHLLSSFTTAEEGLRGMAWTGSHPGKLVTVGPRRVEFWNPTSGQPVQTPILGLPVSSPLAISPDASRVVVADGSHSAGVWDLQAGTPGATVLAPGSHINAFALQGTRALTACDDAVRWWDARDGRLLRKEIDLRGTRSQAALSPDASLLAVAEPRGARLWDLRAPQSPARLLPHDAQAIALVFTPDGEQLITGTRHRQVRRWDSHTGTQIGTPLAFPHLTTSLLVDPTGKVVAVAGPQDLSLWNLATGRRLGETLQFPRKLGWFGFTPTGRTLLTAAGGEVREWDAESGRARRTVVSQSPVIYGAALSPDGRLLATAQEDNHVRLWDVETGKPHGLPMQQGDWLRWLCFSPDGRTLATSPARAVRLWDVATGKPLATSRPLEDYANGLQFSADGTLLVACTPQNIKIWRLNEAPEAVREQGAPAARNGAAPP